MEEDITLLAQNKKRYVQPRGGSEIEVRRRPTSRSPFPDLAAKRLLNGTGYGLGHLKQHTSCYGARNARQMRFIRSFESTDSAVDRRTGQAALSICL